MQTAPTLQKIVTQLAEKHGMNLDNAGAYLRLELPGYGQLVIENIGASRISIANFVQVRTDWLADPAIVVFVDHEPSMHGAPQSQPAWMPIQITEIFGGWRVYAEPDGHGHVILYDTIGQKELATVAEESIARNLIYFGWLEKAKRPVKGVVPWTPDEIEGSDIRVEDIQNVLGVVGNWPEPTVDAPDFETLEAWMVDDGGCEATDGCFVEPDGRCPHGHPSWLLRSG